ncbi:hypothetical protein LWM68_28020 [Niabella sp. W65]|nr:hypothetical protein [Niabella sp. W65]MCH7366281.1 hypothetical protein [Niabella sp. W65]
MFVLFIFNTLSVGVEQKWKFAATTWKVLVGCMYDTFRNILYRQKILKPINS